MTKTMFCGNLLKSLSTVIWQTIILMQVNTNRLILAWILWHCQCMLQTLVEVNRSLYLHV